MRITKTSCEDWLSENIPHIQLVEWGGGNIALSTFRNTNNGFVFKTLFSRVKDSFKKGLRIGLPQEERRMNQSDCEKWLSTNLPNIQLIEWGGKNKYLSVFKNNNNGLMFNQSFERMRNYFKKDIGIGLTKEEQIENTKQTCLRKYGVENPMQDKAIHAKATATNKEKYGVENVALVPEFREKAKQTCMERYGYVTSALHPDVIAQKDKTNIERYGTLNPASSDIVKAKINKTNMERLGVPYPFLSDEIQKKAYDENLRVGNIKLIEGKTYLEWSKEIGRSTSNLNALVLLGFDITQIKKHETNIEYKIAKFLNNININYIQNKVLEGSSYRPDFQLPDHRLIIECDGLYWHSDAIIDDYKYHQKRQEVYTKLGYKSFFFREDEILNKFSIVESIITNALKLNTIKIFARKCEIKPLDKKFLSDYHLMGKGAGRSYGLFYQDKPVLGIQVKWVNKTNKLLEVSRFCSAPNTTVVGGFSKLLKHIEQLENPIAIKTFIDRRYGVGKYLKNLGFEEQTTYLSFKWIKASKVYNRMQFKGATGYDYGLNKLWDCGQTKWVKKCL